MYEGTHSIISSAKDIYEMEVIKLRREKNCQKKAKKHAEKWKKQKADMKTCEIQRTMEGKKASKF